MLKAASPLSQSSLHSALASQSMLRPQGNQAKRSMFASLMLTSLVDAFSILVIFLIMNHSANHENINISDKIKLPQARESQFLQHGVVVRVEGNQLFVEDKPVALSNLAAQLKSLNASVDVARKEGLIVVADKQLDYQALSPVILAGSYAGFTKFKFAVINNN